MIAGVGSPWTLDAVGQSETGPYRKRNEDAFVICANPSVTSQDLVMDPLTAHVLQQPVILAVADGMGGHQLGGEASQLALQSVLPALCEVLDRSPWSFPLHWKKQASAALLSVWHALRERFGDSENSTSGTTLTLLVLYGRGAGLLHIGDSVAYRLRRQQLSLLSEPHSYVGRLVREGRLRAEDARYHPKRNIIEMALTNDPNLTPLPQVAWFPVRYGDQFLLASDGLTDGLEEEQIASLMQEGSSQPLERRLYSLIEQSITRSGRDNTTAIWARVGYP